MKKPTSPNPPRPSHCVRASAASATSTRRAAGRRPAPRLPDLADPSAGTQRLTLGGVVDACMLPACLLLLAEEKKIDLFPVLAKRGYFIADTVLSLLIAAALAAAGVGAGVATWGVLKTLSVVAARLNRRKYLPRERERRRALARERRRIRRRTTLNPAPTAEDLLEAWSHVRESPSDMIRFGSMLCDLEAYVDNSLIHDENGEICGRRPGVRGWLRDNCPVLSAKYKTVMGYKEMANKFRQATGLSDPYPASMALDLMEAEDAARKAGGEADVDANDAFQNTVRRHSGDGAGRVVFDKEIAREAEDYRATKVAEGWGVEARQNMVRRTRALLADCGWSRRSVVAAIDVRVHPEVIPRIVEIAERREQGLPARKSLVERMANAIA